MEKIKRRIEKIEKIKATQPQVNIDLLWKQGKEIEKKVDEVIKTIPLETLQNMFKLLQPSKIELDEAKKHFGEEYFLLDTYSFFRPDDINYDQAIYYSMFYYYAFFGDERSEALSKQIDKESLDKFERAFQLQKDANDIFKMRIDAIKAIGKNVH